MSRSRSGGHPSEGDDAKIVTRFAALAKTINRRHQLVNPLGRIGQPEDIAPAVAFFASPDSSWITGETLVIAGGFR